MIKVYDLHNDVQLVAAMQKATTMKQKPFRRTKWGLFGSSEWWDRIESEGLLRTIEGTITRVFMSGHNDYREFEITDDTSTTSWPRQGEEGLYVVGARVRIEYIETKNIMGGCYPDSKTATRIWIESNVQPDGCSRETG